MDDQNNELKQTGALAWMVKHPVAANLIMVTCIVGGLVFARRVKQEVFPSFERDSVRVSVSYPGASPEEVEKGLILGIEDAVSGIDGIDEIKSEAREGSGTVTIDAATGTDIQKLVQDVEKEVKLISTFPEDAEDPEVSEASHRHEVVKVAIFGNAGNKVLHELAEQFRDVLLQDPKITQVDVLGLPPLEISIEVPAENLRRYGLTLDEIANRIRNASVDLPSGGVKTRGGEILLRIKDRRDYGHQFAKIPVISSPDGGEVLLEQIAVIKDGFEDSDQYSKYNDKPSVLIEVYRVGDQTPISVSDTVKKYLDDFNASLPEGIEAVIRSDRADIYRQRLDLMLRNAGFGLILVFFILAIFLEIRLAFWVMMGIPISFIGSFLFLPMIDVSINMISLFAYIIVLGIVVDDAIVVGENIYHYRQEGMPVMEASIKGVKEMAVPVTFSILTNIATFLPLSYIPGTMGKIFSVIPAVVIMVFLISLGESLFVLPAHLAHQKRKTRAGFGKWLHDKQQTFSTGFKNWVRNVYGPFLDYTLRYRYLTITVFLSILITVLAYGMSGRMGFGLFPKIESDFARVTLFLPYGTAVEKTEKILERLSKTARQVVEESGHKELVEGIFSEVGTRGSHYGRIYVFLAPAEVREKTLSTSEFTKRWRELTGPVIGTEYISFESDAGGPGGGHAVTVELNHRNMSVLEKASSELAEVLGTYPRVSDVDDGFQPGKEQIDFSLKSEGESLGLTSREVARQVRNAFYGREVLRQQRGRNQIKVVARLPEEERISGQSIEELLIRTPSGNDVPLREIASVEYGRAYTSINRRNGRRVVQVGADVSPRSKADEVLTDMKKTALPDLVAKYPGLRYSFEGRRAEMRESLGSLKVTFTLAMFVIFALLAIPFRSYSQPLIVMASIPYGIIGAFLGHLIMGYDLSLVSMFGIVALSGVVVNDSLIMVDTANTLRRKNASMPSHDVIHAAGIQRFRPIILTTLTTFGGLMPIIFETSRQAKFLIPMAISLGFGILFATFITLVLVPSLYMVNEDLRKLVE